MDPQAFTHSIVAGSRCVCEKQTVCVSEETETGDPDTERQEDKARQIQSCTAEPSSVCVCG